jgi:hypothetical protein
MHTFKPLNKNDESVMFTFSKKHIEGYRWAMLPLASKAVYPILCSYRNKKGIAFPDKSTIGCLANLSEKTVRGGLKALIDDGWIKTETYLTRYGNKGYKYFIPKTITARGAWFPFHNEILTSGAWFMTSPSAKALYPVIRCYTEFDYEDSMLEEADYTEFSKRQWEYCRLPDKTNEILKLAGISYNSFKPALASLREVELIGDYDDDGRLKVFLRPPNHYKRAYLNDEIRKKFSWKLKRRNNKTLSHLNLPEPNLENKELPPGIAEAEEEIDMFA